MKRFINLRFHFYGIDILVETDSKQEPNDWSNSKRDYLTTNAYCSSPIDSTFYGRYTHLS